MKLGYFSSNLIEYRFLAFFIQFSSLFPREIRRPNASLFYFDFNFTFLLHKISISSCQKSYLLFRFESALLSAMSLARKSRGNRMDEIAASKSRIVISVEPRGHSSGNSRHILVFLFFSQPHQRIKFVHDVSYWIHVTDSHTKRWGEEEIREAGKKMSNKFWKCSTKCVIRRHKF